MVSYCHLVSEGYRLLTLEPEISQFREGIDFRSRHLLPGEQSFSHDGRFHSGSSQADLPCNLSKGFREPCEVSTVRGEGKHVGMRKRTPHDRRVLDLDIVGPRWRRPNTQQHIPRPSVTPGETNKCSRKEGESQFAICLRSERHYHDHDKGNQ